MTRTVFDNAMVAHVWAQQKQSEGRSGNGNFWFRDSTIYSYRTPIARIYEKIALVSSETFSVTTSGKHMPAIQHALKYKAIRVPHILDHGWRENSNPDHGLNLAYLASCYTDLVAKLKRARDLYSGPLGALQGLAQTYATYCEAFDLAPAHSFDPETDAASITAHHAAKEARNNDPAQIAKREKDKARRLALKEAKEAEALRIARMNADEKIQAWLAGDSVVLPYNARRAESGGVMLRVRGDTLETSQGASVPLPHAIKAFRFVKLCRETGQSWKRNGRTLRVGHFQIDSVTASGDFEAGCHSIKWPEISALALRLGVFDEAASDSALESSHA